MTHKFGGSTRRLSKVKFSSVHEISQPTKDSSTSITVSKVIANY